MATWSDLKTYIHNRYKVANETDDMLRLIFETGNLREQVVLVRRVVLPANGTEWVHIESAIGEIDKLDLVALLRKVGNTVVGGLATAGDSIVTFRHSVPLADLSIAEFEQPLHLVIGTADLLEQQFTGGDRF
jgi:hypothetical protein